MEYETNWKIWKIVFIIANFIMIVLGILLLPYAYHMKEVNCNSILSSNLEVSTEDVSDCYRFNNFPLFWGILVIVLEILTIVFGNCILSLIKLSIETSQI